MATARVPKSSCQYTSCESSAYYAQKGVHVSTRLGFSYQYIFQSTSWRGTSQCYIHLFIICLNSLKCMEVNGETLQLCTVCKSHVSYYKSFENPYQYSHKSHKNLYLVLQVTHSAFEYAKSAHMILMYILEPKACKWLTFLFFNLFFSAFFFSSSSACNNSDAFLDASCIRHIWKELVGGWWLAYDWSPTSLVPRPLQKDLVLTACVWARVARSSPKL